MALPGKESVSKVLSSLPLDKSHLLTCFFRLTFNLSH